MALTARKIPRLTFDEYLAFENASETRHEFVDGLVYAMAGSTDTHGLIAGNIFAAVHGHLPASCQAFMSDMKLRIRLDRAEYVYYPDLLVSCAPADRARLWREQPILLVEVLSPSTARVDEGEKLDHYKRIASLEEYVIIAQDTMRVEIFRRANGWSPEFFYADDTVTFTSIDLSLPVSQIYRRVDLGPRDATA